MTQSLFSKPGHIPIPAPRFEATLQWYLEKLGVTLKARFPDEGRMVAVLSFARPGAAVLLLVESIASAQMGRQPDFRPVPLVTLYCPDIELAHAELKSRGVTVTDIHSHDEARSALYFYITDPNGHVLEAAWSKWDD